MYRVKSEYCLIFGYDSQNVRIYYPLSEEEDNAVIMPMEEAAQYFARQQNDYLCFLPYAGM